MAKIRNIVISGRKFQVAVDEELDTATGKFLKYKYPISSKEIDDFLVMHYEGKSGQLVGFTIKHLKEFVKMVKKAISNHIKRQQLKEKEYLKEKAQEAVYKVISGEERFGILSIPEPFWHKSNMERFTGIRH